MDNFYDNALSEATDGSFKAVCLSGIRTEDNSGGGTDASDAKVTAKYLDVIVRPLAPFGDILPDPLFMKDSNTLNEVIGMHASTFVARSDFEFKDTSPPLFGQILNCYFENGSVANSDFRGLRFSELKATEIHPEYKKLSTMEGITLMEDRDWSKASLLGSEENNSLSEDNVMKKFANELPPPLNAVGGVGINANAFKLGVQGQLDFWKGKKESTSSPQFGMLTAYWNNVGLKKSEWTPGGVPWSAAFISFQLSAYNFKAAASHYKYTEQIIGGLSPGWQAFSLTKGPSIINVGDVLIRPRGSGSPKDKPYWYTHGDVVYKIEGGIAYLAGGNLGDTAKIAARIKVDANNATVDTGKYIVILKKVS